MTTAEDVYEWIREQSRHRWLRANLAEPCKQTSYLGMWCGTHEAQFPTTSEHCKRTANPKETA